jgi:hypothetical protein
VIRLFPSCTGNASFNHQEMRFIEPFKDTNIIIYKSALGQIDSVKFFKWELDTIKYRNFSQGFYNENILNVKYQILNHSYHKLDFGAGLSNYDLEESFLSFLKSKNGHDDKEISFLGLAFGEDYINKILDTKDSSIIFSSEKALYKSVNINEGIKSFKFDFEKGIISFVDKNGVEWVRFN